jgi:hypothetical protein
LLFFAVGFVFFCFWFCFFCSLFWFFFWEVLIDCVLLL